MLLGPKLYFCFMFSRSCTSSQESQLSCPLYTAPVPATALPRYFCELYLRGAERIAEPPSSATLELDAKVGMILHLDKLLLSIFNRINEEALYYFEYLL